MEKYERKRLEEILVVGLVVAALLVAVQSFAFNAPTVPEVSTLVGTETGGPSAIAPANESTNESGTENETGIPEWWYWSKEDFEKMQWYANQTEIVIREDWSLVGTNEPVGQIIVAGEPLYKGYAYEGCPNCGLSENVSPIAYLDGERRGECLTVPAVYFYLRKIRGENVKFIGAKNIDYNPEAGGFHYWTEWTDSEGKEWIGNFDTVMPKDYWYQQFNWTVDWKQFDEPPAIVHGQVNRWTTKDGERVTVISG